MDKNPNTRLREAQQAGDLLLVKLLTNQPIHEDILGRWSPPDVPDECDGHRVVICRDGPRLAPRRWNSRERKLKARYPGILLSYDARESVKFRPPPAPAMLWDWIKSLLDTAWSHWSRATEQGSTTLPFNKWLRGDLVDQPWHDREGWTEAAQALRQSLGLPRFRPAAGGGGNV